ncbi:serine/threonine dehydratase [Bacillus obstructivus]|uniref:threonine ammonia-lyase n=1 Tax=Heyndrickxia oleronia TaxID=38875 RepID=UPI000903144F|nr:threonine/serine dehydratase [Heyndrickxia oleronia]MBU5211520.1 threonine/serine dehydratase [Heyndrickxia oleronia]NYV65612.1 threonine/serine dehydratase [Bacillus sp. Gen3]OJH20807.1 serine/threonine dehydratase [Bacillus obstructivus]
MIRVRDVYHAREQISDIVHVTPVLTSGQLSKHCGNQIFLKSEHLQRTGSFKIRGATNKVKQVVKEGASSVTAASSGNHGQAVAYIANRLNVPATIVVPTNASQCKINAIQKYNGKIIKCGTTSAERLPKAQKIAHQEMGVFIPPYDDPLIMAGQGTIGLEILEQIENVDVIIAPVGGGGLISGILTAVKEIKPSVKMIGVEPELANDTYLSLKNQEITAIPGTNTIADGLRTSQPGDLTFPILQKYLDDLILVKENEIKQALSFVMERMKQIIEPSSAVTIASVLFDKLPFKDKKVVTVISGGNVDIQQINRLVVDTNF